jgi:hypothetical protein
MMNEHFDPSTNPGVPTYWIQDLGYSDVEPDPYNPGRAPDASEILDAEIARIVHFNAENDVSVA